MPDKTDARREAMANISAPGNEALWYSRGKIHEVMFCEYLLRKHPLRCIRNRLYDVNGLVSDDRISREIMQEIKLYCNTEVAKQVNNLVKAVKLMAPDDETPLREDRIHFANGTLFLDGGFTPDKEFCMNRLPVSYAPDAPAPQTWLTFLNSLLHEEDIPTLQEFMGYTLVPTNKAQKMLILVGNGGEGKSRITIVMRAIHGENMNICSLQKLASDRFCRADQEAKLLMVDDDMSMSALPDTDTLKVIITMEEMMDLERKGQQSIQGNIYVRLMAFGNGSLSALHDRSDGFYRRQLTLRVKEKDSARIDDPNLGDKLKEEAEGIVLWSVEGLKRLQANNYHFTISEQTRQIMEEMRRNDNSMIDFYESTGYIMFEANTHATTRQLFNAYRCWCEDNALTPLSERTFANQLRTDEKRLGIRYTKNLEVGAGKRARGYVGVHTQLSDDRLWSFKRWGGG